MNAVLVPSLDDVLADTSTHATTCRVDHDCGVDPAGWPDDVRLAMSLDLTQLGLMHDGVLQVRSIQHACVKFCGQWWCVRRIRYDRVRTDPRDVVATARGETPAPCRGPVDGVIPPGHAVRRSALSLIDGGRP